MHCDYEYDDDDDDDDVDGDEDDENADAAEHDDDFSPTNKIRHRWGRTCQLRQQANTGDETVA